VTGAELPASPVGGHWRLACWGAFLLLLGIYLLAHPGRIDTPDGQHRFEVSKEIIDLRGPIINDYWLLQYVLPQNSESHRKFSYYTAPASLVAVPLMAVSRIINGAKVASDHFSFAMVSAFAGALIAPLLLAFYRRLGVALAHAVGWTLLFGLSTLWWPGAETVYDQCQHGVVLLAMVLTAYDAGKTGRVGSAFACGLLGGLLFNYRTPFAALLPFFPLFLCAEAKRRSEGPQTTAVAPQIAAFALAVVLGFAGYTYYNWIRFGQLQMPSFGGSAHLPLGNPVSGFLTLAVSPGKGVLWFSPPLILAAFGLPALLRHDARLGRLILVLSIVHVGEMSCLAFASGDCCWGPRYLLVTMPLWALAFPFVPLKFAARRVIWPLAALGMIIQVMGVSLTAERFFYYRRLQGDLWLDSWCYFRFSQLAARPAEIWESVEERDRPRPFLTSNPIGQATYAFFGPYPTMAQNLIRRTAKAKTAHPNSTRPQKDNRPTETGYGKWTPPARRAVGYAVFQLDGRDTRTWMQNFAMFYLPRPWWGWIGHVPPDQQPVNPRIFFLVCLAMSGSGLGMLTVASRKERRSAASDEPSLADLPGTVSNGDAKG
jgi:hypothetical protein